MRTRPVTALLMFSAILSLAITFGCSNNDDNDDILTPETISGIEKEALLFMLEEEKMARDVYDYLDEIWNRPEFKNISKSEENHLAAIENLLKLYGVEYTVLPPGVFENTDLQETYQILTAAGEDNLTAALLVGAGIEDLDIYDLQNYINSLDNSRIVSVFQSLQCGSRNHLRAFSSSLDNLGITFEPHFISDALYNEIVQSENENCNL